MKEKILEIQSYFIGKLVDGQFDVVKINLTHSEFTLRVDNEYVFTYQVDFEDVNRIEQETEFRDPNFMILPEMTYTEKVQFISHFEEYRPAAVTE